MGHPKVHKGTTQIEQKESFVDKEIYQIVAVSTLLTKLSIYL